MEQVIRRDYTRALLCSASRITCLFLMPYHTIRLHPFGVLTSLPFGPKGPKPYHVPLQIYNPHGPSQLRGNVVGKRIEVQ